MFDVKILGHLADGKIAVFTFTGENFRHLVGLAAFYGLTRKSPEFANIVLSATKDGLARSVSVTEKTREQLIEAERSKGYKIIIPGEEHNGL